MVTINYQSTKDDVLAALQKAGYHVQEQDLIESTYIGDTDSGQEIHQCVWFDPNHEDGGFFVSNIYIDPNTGKGEF